MRSEMKAAIEYVENAPKVRTKGGGLYTQVAQRIEALRLHFDDLGLRTEIIKDDGDIIVMRAALVHLPTSEIISTGFAEEVRGSSAVNKTSALENCETSAIGRCLAGFGLHGGEYASANEVEKAIEEQSKPTIDREQMNRLIQLLRDGGLTDPEIDEYRQSLRIGAWGDLTCERYDRLYGKLEAKLARQYAEGEAAADAAEKAGA